MRKNKEKNRKIRKKDLEVATENVICRKDESMLDEAPQAYKDINKVISYQKDLIKRKHVFYPIACVKG
ncbi:MAG: RtcB family protein [Candidatus Pacearchaeota archaeon]|nr:RtcB family protein [Candidatus Pacearchaeota archaeon]